MHFLSVYIITLFILFQTGITGKVIYVNDGDTFILETSSGKKIKVRIEGIDAPESHQEFGLEAKEFLAGEILNKIVRLQAIATDRYGRLIAKVYYGHGKNLGQEMIKKGFAWHYVAYNKEQSLVLYQNFAHDEKLGLWSNGNPIPPWEFRKFGSTGIRTQKPALVAGTMVLVCNSETSYAYHSKHCHGLRQCNAGIAEITIESARKAGRKPCGYCWPDE